MRTARPLVTCSRMTLRDAVSHVAVDLDAAVDRAGMHDEAVGFERAARALVRPKERGVFAKTGKIFLALAFVLDAEKIDHVGVRQDLVELVSDTARRAFQTRAGPALTDRRAVTFAPSL